MICLRAMICLLVLAIILGDEGKIGVCDESHLYEQQIKPIFSEKCITCHGALRSEAGLRLDAIQFIREGSDEGSIVKSDESGFGKLIDRVTSKDADLRMPPEDAGTAMSQAQIAALTRWIEKKLPGPSEEPFINGPQEHWAYQPIVRSVVPRESSDTVQNPIDRFIQLALKSNGLRSLAPANETAWLRRVKYDVTGLPPTVDELTRFIEEKSSDKREKWIDEFLAKPSYGERWGRHWMDVWRYSDWDGYKNDLRSSQKHIWHWRDWIIESLNANKSYDQMVVEMLAADELSPDDTGSLRATGFLARNYHKSNRNIWLDATVEHTAKAFLGMTLNCAKCHDHKYDPVSQTAYYQFRAIFEPHQIRTDQFLGFPNIEFDGLPRAFDGTPETPTYLYVRGNDKNPLKDSPIEPAVPSFLQVPFEIVPIDLPIDSYFPELSSVVRENVFTAKQKAEQNAIAKLQTKLKQVESTAHGNTVAESDASAEAKRLERRMTDIELATSELHVAMADRISTRARYAADDATYLVLLKSEADSLETERDSRRTMLAREAAIAEHRYQSVKLSHDVLLKQRGVMTVQESKEADSTKRKTAIKTAEEALQKAKDELAKTSVELSKDAIDYSHVGKELPHQSTGRRLALAKWIVDSKNPLTARVAINHIWLRHFGTPLVESTYDFGMTAPKPELHALLDWLAAEFIASGWDMKHIHRLILSSDVYAAASDDSDVARYQKNAAIDPENRYFWRANVRRLDAEEIRDSLLAVADVLDDRMSGPDIDFAEGDKVMRRSLYFRHAYEKQMPMLVLFDAASPNECYRRKPSLVPQQALALANSPLARRLAKQFAEECFEFVSKLEASHGTVKTAFIDRLFQTALSRLPTANERDTCETFLDSQTLLLSDPTRLTRFSDDVEIESSALSPEVRARQSLAIVLFNHHDFVSIR